MENLSEERMTSVVQEASAELPAKDSHSNEGSIRHGRRRGMTLRCDSPVEEICDMRQTCEQNSRMRLAPTAPNMARPLVTWQDAQNLPCTSRSKKVEPKATAVSQESSCIVCMDKPKSHVL